MLPASPASSVTHSCFKRLALAVTAFTSVAFTSYFIADNAYADNCGRVNAYWHSNMQNLVQNIRECDSFAWQKCSQAAAIHYELNEGSIGQRVQQCGFNTTGVPGQDYTKVRSNDTGSCLTARNELRDIFETRALARLACAAAREGGSNQEWLDSQCKLFRAQMGNYHLTFRSVVQQCELGNDQLVATLSDE